MRGKDIVKLGFLIFISAFVVAIASDNSNLGASMVLISFGCFIVGAFIECFSPESKARSAEKRARYEAIRRETQQKATAEKAKELENSGYITRWSDVEILDFQEGWRKSYLLYTVTCHDGSVQNHKTNIAFFLQHCDTDKVISVEHIGNASRGVLKFFSAAKPLFIVTYIDGSKGIVTAREGSREYMKLLSLVGKTEEEVKRRTRPSAEQKASANRNEQSRTATAGNFKLGINELPQGEYIIGKDIPAGAYDFSVVYGSGHFSLYSTDENGNKIWEGSQYYNIGIENDYEKKELIHINCIDGWKLIISRNVVVRIARSQNVKIDL